MRKTKIVATVGPACSQEKILLSLIREGVDVFRINASHTDADSLKRWIFFIRKISKKIKRPLPVMVDLQGPRLRTGKLEGGKPVFLQTGAQVTLISSAAPGHERLITTPCREFPRMVKRGDRVLVDNGFLELEVLSTKKEGVDCRIVTGGILGENKGINLPNAPVTLPALSQKDLVDLQVAADCGVDFIALSFVRSANDVMAVKNWMKRRNLDIPIIAKIEKPRAVTHLNSIADVSDAVMVARGDLGIELGVEKVPVIQKELIREINLRPMPVITATQMLESMILQARPTRAEASDVANAVFDGTDAVMLSGETSVGKYPVETVRMMRKIILEVESRLGEIQSESTAVLADSHEEQRIRAITHAARHAAKDLRAKAIIVFTRSGKTAALISKFRPLSPIIALTPNEEVSRRLALLRGVISHKIHYTKSTDTMISEADRTLLRLGLLKRGDCVVVLAGRLALPGARYMTKIHFVGEEAFA